MDFFETEVPTNPMKAEYLLPTIIGGMLRKGTCTVRALPISDIWYGMRYQEDVATITEAFSELLKAGLDIKWYPISYGGDYPLCNLRQSVGRWCDFAYG